MADLFTLNELDSGFTFLYALTKREDASVLDVSDAELIQFIFQKPSGAYFTVVAEFVTDGVDGKVKYITQSDDFNEFGKWKVQAVVTFSINSIAHSEVKQFKVVRNLPY